MPSRQHLSIGVDRAVQQRPALVIGFSPQHHRKAHSRAIHLLLTPLNQEVIVHKYPLMHPCSHAETAVQGCALQQFDRTFVHTYIHLTAGYFCWQGLYPVMRCSVAAIAIL